MNLRLEKLNQAIENPLYNYAHHNALYVIEKLLNHCRTESTRLQLENYITILNGCDYYWMHKDCNHARIPEFILLCKAAKAFIENAIKQGSIV